MLITSIHIADEFFLALFFCRNRWATDAGKDDKINVQAFGEFCSTHETLLHSAHDLQTRLKDRVLGSAFWDGVAARELFLWKKEKVSVAQLLDTVSTS